MHTTPERTIKSFRVRDDVYHQARVAAVTSRMGLGEWLEEAILEKLDRESHTASPEPDSEGGAQNMKNRSREVQEGCHKRNYENILR